MAALSARLTERRYYASESDTIGCPLALNGPLAIDHICKRCMHGFHDGSAVPQDRQPSQRRFCFLLTAFRTLPFF